MENIVIDLSKVSLTHEKVIQMVSLMEHQNSVLENITTTLQRQEETYARIIAKQDEHSVAIAGVKKKVAKLQTGFDVIYKGGEHFSFPLQNMDELDKIEQDLIDPVLGKRIKIQVDNALPRGKTFKLTNLMVDDLVAQFNIRGNSTKKGLDDLNLMTYVKSKHGDIQSLMVQNLRTVKGRVEKRKIRKEKKTSGL